MVVWSWIRSPVSLLLVLVCLLTSLDTAGVTASGAMLILFSWIACLILAEFFFCLPLDLCRLYRGLSCGEVILALQSSDAVHVGVDNLGVVRHVGRLLDGCYCSSAFELVTDGDLLVLFVGCLIFVVVIRFAFLRLKGHADEGMVLDGRVRELDRLGDNAADEAADFGRRRVGNAVIDARRNLSGVSGWWYLVILDLHRFFIAISRAVVDHDDKMELPLILWCGLLVLCPEGDGWFMLSVTWLCFLDEWVAGHAVTIGDDDVAQWPLHSWSSG